MSRELPSNRSFGVVFTVFFALVGGARCLQGAPPRSWALVVAVVVAWVTLLRPELLSVPNRLWARLGFVLQKVVQPVAMSVVFFVVITPLALVLKLTGRDPLRLKIDREARSYWIERTQAEDFSQSMRLPY